MRQLQLLIILLFGLSHAVVRTVGPTDDLNAGDSENGGQDLNFKQWSRV